MKEEIKKEMERLTNEAYNMPLEILCEKVLKGSYTPGIHDSILLERCKKLNYVDSSYPYEHS